MCYHCKNTPLQGGESPWAAAGPRGRLTGGEKGMLIRYRMPCNRPNRDSVVDLAPGGRASRSEFQGRLITAAERPLAGALLYVYHADSRGQYGTPEYPAIPTLTRRQACYRAA